MTRISIDISDTVTPLLVGAPDRIARAISGVVEDTTEKAFQRIKFATPRDSGDASAGWTKGQKTNSAGVASETIENDVPYINVLERGGYPVVPASSNRSVAGGLRRGKAILGGGYPPGPRTQTAPGGTPSMLSNVSKQAPSGMVRKTLSEIEPEFAFDLDEAVNRALNGETL